MDILGNTIIPLFSGEVSVSIQLLFYYVREFPKFLEPPSNTVKSGFGINYGVKYCLLNIESVQSPGVIPYGSAAIMHNRWKVQ